MLHAHVYGCQCILGGGGRSPNSLMVKGRQFCSAVPWGWSSYHRAVLKNVIEMGWCATQALKKMNTEI